MAVLGISIGTRRNGIAVIRAGQLEAAKMHSLVDRWSPHKSKAILATYDKYVQRYSVRTIVVKTPKASHFTLAIKQLIRELNAYVLKQGCLIEYKTIEHIKAAEPSIKNRNKIFHLVVEKYPLLSRELRMETKNKHPYYYMKMFEAVIVAHLHIRDHE